MRADVESLFGERKRPDMPAWLEVLLNLSGYAGFVALASRGTAGPQVPADDRVYSDDR
ncbi:hypothetical protein SAMN05216573_108342 [Bradyrhizobium sp. Rc3b]|nr:hypothetical protein SAMN05216573_108342 [Bradyrhizobium sp. Rc3b]